MVKIAKKKKKKIDRNWNRRFSKEKVNNLEAIRETKLTGKYRVSCDALKADSINRTGL